MEASKPVSLISETHLKYDEALSRSESSILHLLRAGDKYNEIAHQFGISSNTVRNVVNRIRKKLGFKTTVELLVYIRRQGEGEQPKAPKLIGCSNRRAVFTGKLSIVAQGLMEGKKDKEIALELETSVHTARYYVERAMRKTGTANRAEFGVWYRHYLDYQTALENGKTS